VLARVCVYSVCVCVYGVCVWVRACVCVSSLVSTHWSVIWVAYGEGTHPLHKHLPALWPQCFVVVAALSITIV